MIKSIQKGETVKNPARIKKQQIAASIALGVTFFANKYFPGQFDDGALEIISDAVYVIGPIFIAWVSVASTKLLGTASAKM